MRAQSSITSSPAGNDLPTLLTGRPTVQAALYVHVVNTIMWSRILILLFHFLGTGSSFKSEVDYWLEFPDESGDWIMQ